MSTSPQTEPRSAEQALGICTERYDTPTLETARLILRPLHVDDAKTVFENWASDPDVTRYMSWNTHTGIEDTLAWLELEQATLDAPDNFTFGFVLKDDGELIGSGGILFNEEECAFGMGYCLMKKCWNKGYATEAMRRILDFAIHDLGITDLFAYHAVDNPASGKVLTKLGFVYEKDGSYTGIDGLKTFPSRIYRYHVNSDAAISPQAK